MLLQFLETSFYSLLLFTIVRMKLFEIRIQNFSLLDTSNSTMRIYLSRDFYWVIIISGYEKLNKKENLNKGLNMENEELCSGIQQKFFANPYSSLTGFSHLPY